MIIPGGHGGYHIENCNGHDSNAAPHVAFPDRGREMHNNLRVAGAPP
jgi:hypothetical protein